jgi:hypothetical protein
MDGHSFLRAFELERYISRDKQKCPASEHLSLSLGAPLGNQEGIHLPGCFERKLKYIWVPFLDPEDI